jgi:hypothetical protein
MSYLNDYSCAFVRLRENQIGYALHLVYYCGMDESQQEHFLPSSKTAQACREKMSGCSVTPFLPVTAEPKFLAYFSGYMFTFSSFLIGKFPAPA